MASERVEFQTSDGYTLRGDFYRTEADRAPIVVLVPGLFLLKEHFQGPICKRLQSAGYNALVYDHRGWGHSDPPSSSQVVPNGFPRQEYNPIQQAKDIHDAVLFAKGLKGVDGERLILWGTGHGGGASLIAAADDANVKAVIGAFPWFSGAQNLQFLPEGLLEAAKAEEEAHKKAYHPDPEQMVKYTKIWDESLEEARGPRGNIFAHGKDVFALLETARELSSKAGNSWANRVTLRSFVYLTSTEPQDYMHKLRKPLLVVCGPQGVFTYDYEGQKKVSEKVPDGYGKELVLVQGEDIRETEPCFEPMMEAHLAFLKKHFE